MFILGKPRNYLDIDEKGKSPSPDHYSPNKEGMVNKISVTIPKALREFSSNPLDQLPGPG